MPKVLARIALSGRAARRGEGAESEADIDDVGVEMLCSGVCGEVTVARQTNAARVKTMAPVGEPASGDFCECSDKV